jgi:hypothetical protein
MMSFIVTTRRPEPSMIPAKVMNRTSSHLMLKNGTTDGIGTAGS